MQAAARLAACTFLLAPVQAPRPTTRSPGRWARAGLLADVLPQTHSGTLDCAITGTLSGHTVGLPTLTSHRHTLALGWRLWLFAANSTACAARSPALRQRLQTG